MLVVVSILLAMALGIVILQALILKNQDKIRKIQDERLEALRNTLRYYVHKDPDRGPKNPPH